MEKERIPHKELGGKREHTKRNKVEKERTPNKELDAEREPPTRN